MGKRKREEVTLQLGSANGKNGKTRRIAEVAATPVHSQSHIQIIAGSYERTLHGIIATVPRQVLYPDRSNKKAKLDADEKENKPKSKEQTLPATDLDITFADSFLFTAHTSAVRCLALSPVPAQSDAAQKVTLATGSTDERINLYNLSSQPPAPPKKGDLLPTSLSGVQVTQNTSNRELGSLLHHNGPLTSLYFPTRSKLISAAEDNTIAISRTRDWTVLSTIKAPIPKAIGRPSGDTAAPGEVPAGVNDFAVHPSMKLMLTVGKGERCMRLWNLVTGKRAGVLAFERDMLQQVGEGRYGTGEGRRILWDASGDEFAVAFERGACVYDVDCAVRSIIVPKPASKIHQMWYVPGLGGNVLAVSTEDGRILFFATEPASASSAGDEDSEPPATSTKTTKKPLPQAVLFAQLGGRTLNITSRIKDFVILSPSTTSTSDNDTGSGTHTLLLITGNSDGSIRLWSLSAGELEIAREAVTQDKVPQVGHLLAQYETGHRITCLRGFVMNERVAGKEGEAEGEESEFGGFSAGEEEEEGSEDESESGSEESD